MKTYKWFSTFILLVLMTSLMTACVNVTSTVGTEKTFDEQLARQLQAILEAAVEHPDTNFPGAMLHISSPELGNWSGAAGVRNIETTTPMRPDDKFRAGSILKIFIAVVTLQLVEEGMLSLDDPMTAVLPESVTAKFVHSDQISVRMLLNQTSGIADWLTETVAAELVADPAKVWNVDELLDIGAAQGPHFAPGEQHAYSNTNYSLLGLIIEQATDRSWQEEVHGRIIEALPLENTYLPESGDLSIPDDHAHGYYILDGQLVDFAVDPSMAGAAGGDALATTGKDLIRFLDALQAGELFQKDETVDEMMTFVDAPDEDGVPYWYGLALKRFVLPGDIEIVGHDGGAAGFNSIIYHVPAQSITLEATVNVEGAADMGNLYFEIVIPALEILTSFSG